MDIKNQYDRFSPSRLFDSEIVDEAKEPSGTMMDNYSLTNRLRQLPYNMENQIYLSEGYAFIIGEEFSYIETKYEIRNHEVLRNFIKQHPEFRSILRRASNELEKGFSVVSKPIIRVDNDPEYGGDLMLDVFFSVEERTDSTIDKLFEFRREFRKSLSGEHRFLIRFYIK